MTSSLTIVNDSGFDMVCNIGPDEAALAIFGYITTGIAALAAAVVTLGAAAPTLAAVGVAAASNAVIIPGLASAIAITEAAAAITGVTVTKTAVAVLSSVVTFIVKSLEDNGVRIPAGGSHRWDGLTLSLWQQGHCTRVRQFDEEMKAVIDEVYMRPIFSGPLIGSNNDHNIQFWVDKFGYEHEQTLPINPPEGMQSWGDVHAPLLVAGTSLPSGTIAPSNAGSEMGTSAPSNEGSEPGTSAPSNGGTSSGSVFGDDDGFNDDDDGSNGDDSFDDDFGAAGDDDGNGRLLRGRK